MRISFLINSRNSLNIHLSSFHPYVPFYQSAILFSSFFHILFFSNPLSYILFHFLNYSFIRLFPSIVSIFFFSFILHIFLSSFFISLCLYSFLSVVIYGLSVSWYVTFMINFNRSRRLYVRFHQFSRSAPMSCSGVIKMMLLCCCTTPQQCKISYLIQLLSTDAI